MINFVHRYVDNCLVAVSGSGPLTDADFETFQRAIRDERVSCYLSYSSGQTEVSKRQRSLTAEVLKKRNIRTALINESRAVKSLVTAGRVMGLVSMRVFKRSELDRALDYLEIVDRKAVNQALDACCQELRAVSSSLNHGSG